MDTTPFLIQTDLTGKPLKPVDPATAFYQESWLQELLRQHPEILPLTDFEPISHPLIPIGREVPVNTGVIDNLFISEQGHLIIVETKLWRNPDARRDVLAQLIDYASSVSDWTLKELDRTTQTYTKQYVGKALGLYDWLSTRSDFDIERPNFEDMVSKNLRLGRMLTLVVGDRIRDSVIDMLGYLNKYPHLAMNVALIEMRCFTLSEEKDSALLVVPSIVAKTKIVERSIVQVNVTVDGNVKVSAEQEKLNEASGSARLRLSEDDFWDQLKKRDPESLTPAHHLLDWYREKAGIVIRPRSNSMAVHLYPPESDQKISLFFIRTDGIIECWHPTIANQLVKVKLDTQLMDEYIHKIQGILKHSTKKLSYYNSVKKVDIDEFISVVDEFTEKIIQAEATTNP